MARGESRYIFGMHDLGGEQPMVEKQKLGWILVDERIFANSHESHGGDYTLQAEQGFGIIVRLNYDYFPKGTIPPPSLYDAFAARVGRFVKNSQGGHIWIIGNEMNHEQERPDGALILPAQYAACYQKCWQAIHIPGHDDHQVLIGAVGPWNHTTQYAGNLNGDWVQYLADLIQEIRGLDCPIDGFALHTYTQGKDPKLVFSETRMKPHFPQLHTHFRAYRDFMAAIPRDLRHLPVYITECNRNCPWDDENTGWIRSAYKEIDDWNSMPGNQQIRCLLLYRWQGDKWKIKGKGKVLDDWRMAMEHEYVWRELEYKAAFLAHSFPDVVTAGQPFSGRVRVRNQSRMTWPAGGENPVRLGYTWYRDGQRVPVEGVARSALPHNVPGETDILLPEIQVVAPKRAGKYVLQLDLVHEFLAWFSDKGNEPLSVEVEVREQHVPPKPDMEDITDRLPRHPEKQYETRSLDQIRYLIIHHSGVRAEIGPGRFAAHHVNDLDLPGIRYHFVIGDRGQIWQTQPLTTISEQAEAGDLPGVGICVCGGFWGDRQPTPVQMESLARLCNWLIHELGLASVQEIVRGRKDFARDTTDPSYVWNKRSPGDGWEGEEGWRNLLLQKMAGT